MSQSGAARRETCPPGTKPEDLFHCGFQLKTTFDHNCGVFEQYTYKHHLQLGRDVNMKYRAERKQYALLYSKKARAPFM